MLLARETATSGWSYDPAQAQPHLEPTCRSLRAPRYSAEPRVAHGLEFLLRVQNSNGSWPDFAGDDQEDCWVTSLALLNLHKFGEVPNGIGRGVNWLLDFKGKESHWLWKWKFRTTDTHVHFDPDKFEWPWMPDTNSWVIPTSFALLALRRYFRSYRPSNVRVRSTYGIAMLFDRVCPNGVWNAGNGVVYELPLASHLDVTEIALFALRGQKQNAIINASLSGIEGRSLFCSAPAVAPLKQ